MRCKKQERHQTASMEVFHELAVKNVKRSARDYLIYFMTLTLAVALFYTFNSIEAQFSILGIPDTKNFLSFSAGIMAGVSLFICVIMGFLAVYANRFMLKRRKREMGIYLTLGMEQEDISALMWKETCLIGGASLVAGLVLGLGMSQGLSLITAQIIGAGLSHYHLVLSLKAIVAAILFFGGIFFIVHRLNVREVRRMQLIELLHAERKNEKASKSGLKDILFFLAAVILMIAGYVHITTGTRMSFAQGMTVGIGLIAVGTVLFCLSVSSLFVKLCKKNKKYYYSRLHIFVVNQLGSRLKNTGVSVGVVSIMIFLSIASMALGLGMGSAPMGDTDETAPYDVSIQFDAKEEGGSLGGGTVEQMLAKKGFKLSEYVKEAAEVRVYMADGITYNLLHSEKYPGTDDMGEYHLNIVGIDDYNRVRELKGEPLVTLGDQEYAINYSEKGAKEKLLFYMKHQGQTLDLNGTQLSPARDGLYNYVYYNGTAYTDDGTLLVPQRVTEGLDLALVVYNGTFRSADSYGKLVEAYRDAPVSIDFVMHKDAAVEVMSDTLTVTYIGIYLGITFLIVAGAVLALQQLSQSSDNEERYELLRKLGTGESDMRESLRMQLLVYFGLPFVLAVVNAGFVIGGIFSNMPELTALGIFQAVAFSTGLVAVVYGLYFLITYMGSRRILKV